MAKCFHYKIGPFPASFSLLSSFQYSWQIIFNIKFACGWDWTATALPFESQPITLVVARCLYDAIAALLCTFQPVWPDWAIFSTLGNFLKPLATISLPKSLTFLGNFWKGVKIYHFSSESFLGNFYRHLAIFFWSHWFQHSFIDPFPRSRHFVCQRTTKYGVHLHEVFYQNKPLSLVQKTAILLQPVTRRVWYDLFEKFPMNFNQCDQIGRFIGLWASF